MWLLVVVGLCFGWTKHYLEFTQEIRLLKQQIIGVGTSVVNGAILKTGITRAGLIANYVEVSIGSDDGLKQGMHCHVQRKGQGIGSVIIEEVQSDRAVAICTDFQKGMAASEGDEIVAFIEIPQVPRR